MASKTTAPTVPASSLPIHQPAARVAPSLTATPQGPTTPILQTPATRLSASSSVSSSGQQSIVLYSDKAQFREEKSGVCEFTDHAGSKVCWAKGKNSATGTVCFSNPVCSFVGVVARGGLLYNGVWHMADGSKAKVTADIQPSHEGLRMPYTYVLVHQVLSAELSLEASTSLHLASPESILTFSLHGKHGFLGSIPDALLYRGERGVLAVPTNKISIKADRLSKSSSRLLKVFPWLHLVSVYRASPDSTFLMNTCDLNAGRAADILQCWCLETDEHFRLEPCASLPPESRVRWHAVVSSTLVLLTVCLAEANLLVYDLPLDSNSVPRTVIRVPRFAEAVTAATHVDGSLRLYVRYGCLLRVFSDNGEKRAAESINLLPYLVIGASIGTFKVSRLGLLFVLNGAQISYFRIAHTQLQGVAPHSVLQPMQMDNEHDQTPAAPARGAAAASPLAPAGLLLAPTYLGRFLLPPVEGCSSTRPKFMRAVDLCLLETEKSDELLVVCPECVFVVNLRSVNDGDAPLRPSPIRTHKIDDDDDQQGVEDEEENSEDMHGDDSFEPTPKSDQKDHAMDAVESSDDEQDAKDGNSEDGVLTPPSPARKKAAIKKHNTYANCDTPIQLSPIRRARAAAAAAVIVPPVPKPASRPRSKSFVMSDAEDGDDLLAASEIDSDQEEMKVSVNKVAANKKKSTDDQPDDGDDDQMDGEDQSDDDDADDHSDDDEPNTPTKRKKSKSRTQQHGTPAKANRKAATQTTPKQTTKGTKHGRDDAPAAPVNQMNEALANVGKRRKLDVQNGAEASRLLLAAPKLKLGEMVEVRRGLPKYDGFRELRMDGATRLTINIGKRGADGKLAARLSNGHQNFAEVFPGKLECTMPNGDTQEVRVAVKIFHANTTADACQKIQMLHRNLNTILFSHAEPLSHIVTFYGLYWLNRPVPKHGAPAHPSLEIEVDPPNAANSSLGAEDKGDVADKPRLLLVSELMESDLAKKLAMGEPREPAQRVDILKQIVIGVKSFHSPPQKTQHKERMPGAGAAPAAAAGAAASSSSSCVSVTHHDLCPSNIFLKKRKKEEGGGWLVKIGDFDDSNPHGVLPFSRLQTPGHLRANPTGKGHERYNDPTIKLAMGPDGIPAPGAIGPHNDIYSLGMVAADLCNLKGDTMAIRTLSALFDDVFAACIGEVSSRGTIDDVKSRWHKFEQDTLRRRKCKLCGLQPAEIFQLRCAKKLSFGDCTGQIEEEETDEEEEEEVDIN